MLRERAMEGKRHFQPVHANQSTRISPEGDSATVVGIHSGVEMTLEPVKVSWVEVQALDP